MTPEQWQRIEQRLSGPWGSVKLRVDGYDLTLQVHSIGKLRYRIYPYVNGEFRGLWLSRNEQGDWREEARRFLPLIKRRLWSSAKLKRMKIRARTAKEMGLDGIYEYRRSYWTLFAALKRHLIANNEHIEVVSEDLTRTAEAVAGDAPS